MDLLPDRKPRAYTSVLSAMQLMQKKTLLTIADMMKIIQHAD
ncbi:MAG TPA: hypothetical protein DCG12_21035 [Planctomycetaceae bacterium]|nr:hypothetical protein [Planctomycetaceae bacterium]|tara:strand:- start:60 stop:185 length:126 start_codon:yes stop_codon:yes gene_type:complete